MDSFSHNHLKKAKWRLILTLAVYIKAIKVFKCRILRLKSGQKIRKTPSPIDSS
jgi:hypothetical protein